LIHLPRKKYKNVEFKTIFSLLGLSPDVVPLLQRYLDSTGDIQTVSILVLKTIPREIVHENAVMMSWINRYEIIFWFNIFCI